MLVTVKQNGSSAISLTATNHSSEFTDDIGPSRLVVRLAEESSDGQASNETTSVQWRTDDDDTSGITVPSVGMSNDEFAAAILSDFQNSTDSPVSMTTSDNSTTAAIADAVTDYNLPDDAAYNMSDDYSHYNYDNENIAPYYDTDGAAHTGEYSYYYADEHTVTGPGLGDAADDNVADNIHVVESATLWDSGSVFIGKLNDALYIMFPSMLVGIVGGLLLWIVYDLLRHATIKISSSLFSSATKSSKNSNNDVKDDAKKDGGSSTDCEKQHKSFKTAEPTKLTVPAKLEMKDYNKQRSGVKCLPRSTRHGGVDNLAFNGIPRHASCWAIASSPPGCPVKVLSVQHLNASP